MRFDWGEFNTLAGELLETASISSVPEATVRAALGRTCYAVFGIARDVLEARGVEIPDKKAHATVRRVLGTSNEEIEQSIGLTLNDLFRLRVMADYDASPGVPLTIEVAQQAYLVGTSAVTMLKSIDEERDEPGDPR